MYGLRVGGVRYIAHYSSIDRRINCCVIVLLSRVLTHISKSKFTITLTVIMDQAIGRRDLWLGGRSDNYSLLFL